VNIGVIIAQRNRVADEELWTHENLKGVQPSIQNKGDSTNKAAVFVKKSVYFRLGTLSRW
jgi:hypothetical protein